MITHLLRPAGLACLAFLMLGTAPAAAATLESRRIYHERPGKSDPDAPSSGCCDLTVGADLGILAIGANIITGDANGDGATGLDDYIFTIGSGTILESIRYVSGNGNLIGHALVGMRGDGSIGDLGDFLLIPNPDDSDRNNGLDLFVHEETLPLGAGTYKLDSRSAGGGRYDWTLSVVSAPISSDDIAPVPVPASLPLLAGGIGALVVAARRRRRVA